MEEKQEKIVANETIGTSKFLERDCNISMNPIEPEACGSVVSTNSKRPGSSTLIDLDTINDYCMNKAGCSSVMGGNNEPERWSHKLECDGQESKGKIDGDVMVSTDKGSLDSSLRDDLKKVLSTFQNVKCLPSNQSNVDLIAKGPNNNILCNMTNIVSTQATTSRSNIFSGNKTLEGSFSSSFPKFLPRESLKKTISCVLDKNPGVFYESLTKPTVQYKTQHTLMAQNDDMHDHSSGEAFHPMLRRNSLRYQLQPHDMVSEEPEMPHHGINLRDWLESSGAKANKNEKLCLFRKIVKIVDFAHSKRIALMELRPSSFTMLETGDVEYIGLLMETMNQETMNQKTIKKRGLEVEFSARGKMQRLGGDDILRPETCSISKFVKDKAADQFSHGNFDVKNSSHFIWNAQCSTYEDTSTRNSWLTSGNAQLENRWYAFPDDFKTKDLLSLNIYSLGVLLFEFLCHFGSVNAHSAAMLDLQQRILPPCFISECPKEAGFCFWLLHPEPSSRPTTREILQSQLIYECVNTNMRKDQTSFTDMDDDVELNLLLHFLVTLKQHKQDKASNLLESLEFLNTDIKVVENRQACRKYLNERCGRYDSNLKDNNCEEDPCSNSKMNELRDKLFENINELENVYFSLRSNVRLSEIPDMDRSDKDVLRKRDTLSWVQAQRNFPTTDARYVDRVGMFFDGICNFARCHKFEVCGTLRNDNILKTDNVICSLSFDCDEDLIATAGVSKKIKIFEVASLLDDLVDVHYPVLEMSNKSKFSCICWNSYIRSYLASTDYDGSVQIWDASTGQGFAQYNEHQNRAWSVDFSRLDPKRFASGGDDCSLRIWSTTERNSMCTISNPANICCVQFSPYSSHLLAFGSADYKIYCYDLRHMRIPWCTLVGHDNTVSYVRFLDPETLVSASIDNTLKLWDLNKTSLEGMSSNACSLTLRGHTNEKNFVGLAVLDGYITCGSETNEVYAYYRSLPMPITSHKFGYMDPISGYEVSDVNEHFVSSVCWRRNSQMLVAANSSGNMKFLRMT